MWSACVRVGLRRGLQHGEHILLSLHTHLVQGDGGCLGQGEGLAEHRLVSGGLADPHGGAEARHGAGVVVHGLDTCLADPVGAQRGLGLGEQSLHGFQLVGGGPGLAGGLGTGGLVGFADADPLGVDGVVGRAVGIQLGGLLVGALLQAVGLPGEPSHGLHHVGRDLLRTDRRQGELFRGQGVDDGEVVNLGLDLLGGFRGLGGGNFRNDGGGLLGHDGLLCSYRLCKSDSSNRCLLHCSLQKEYALKIDAT